MQYTDTLCSVAEPDLSKYRIGYNTNNDVWTIRHKKLALSTIVTANHTG
jgi:hypothetical protein